MDETNKTRLKQMQEIDAKIEKINYDFLGIESRKKEMEDKKVEKQKEIEKLEKDKDKLTMRSEDMSKARKIIYIVMNLQKDIKSAYRKNIIWILYVTVLQCLSFLLWLIFALSYISFPVLYERSLIYSTETVHLFIVNT